jgi:predicted Zn finger-like uncharacterized protein
VSNAIQISCPNCRATLMIPQSMVGKQVRCPKCRCVFAPQAKPRNIRSAPTIQIDDDLGPAYETPIDRYVRESRQRESNVGFRCPFCQANDPPEVKSRISTAGWVIFVILLIACFPLCIIGLFIREDYRVCSSCGIKLG